MALTNCVNVLFIFVLMLLVLLVFLRQNPMPKEDLDGLVKPNREGLFWHWFGTKRVDPTEVTYLYAVTKNTRQKYRYTVRHAKRGK